MDDKKPPVTDTIKNGPQTAQPGDGIRSLRSTMAFRAINFELYAKPNIVIMTLGLIGLSGALGYIAWMRHKYEAQGYYVAVQNDGTEIFTKRKSKWEE
uniref:Small integral membrane protein 8 n=1 Tax=Culicoides sonorensis TaxID=179676 RepID=A0A336KE03_CULSO